MEPERGDSKQVADNQSFPEMKKEDISISDKMDLSNQKAEIS